MAEQLGFVVRAGWGGERRTVQAIFFHRFPMVCCWNMAIYGNELRGNMSDVFGNWEDEEKLWASSGIMGIEC